MINYAIKALDFLPSTNGNIGIASIVWMQPPKSFLSDDDWMDNVEELEDQFEDSDDPEGVKWLGIIPQGTPIAVWGGMTEEDHNVCIAPVWNPVAGAHELGHTLGLKHVNISNAQQSPKGPFDTVENGGLLQRNPWDVRTHTPVGLPAGDLMSYYSPQRIGKVNWLRLFARKF